MIFANVVYTLCALTSLACAGMLIRGYRRSRSPLLLWSCFCFVGLGLNNILLMIDLIFVPGFDLSPTRTAVAMVSHILLVYGLVTET